MFIRAVRPLSTKGTRAFASGRGKGKGLLEAYGNLLETAPLVTKVMTSAAIVGTGDLM